MGAEMLSDEEKKKIEAEEKYRAELRANLPPQKVEGLHDKTTRFGLWFGIGGALLAMAACALVGK
jgi:hypothetical protein